MHRFLVAPDGARGPSISLSPDESHHAIGVLRLKPGDEIEVLDGTGTIRTCRVTRADRRAVMAEVLSERAQPRPPPVHLAPALLKGAAMDTMLRMATELGAASITPISARRCVVRIEPDAAVGKLEGWARTVAEACKQCGSAWAPRLELPRSLEEFLAMRPRGPLVAALLGPERLLPGVALARCADREGEPILVTGPEGDFTPEEQEMLLAAGALPVTLGPLVLRADTAVVAGLAILQHESAREGSRTRQGQLEQVGKQRL